jgi:glycosyltransferase involved in cell wall biosynthesis
VAAAERGKWRRILLEWHVRPSPEGRGHIAALRAADLHIPVSVGIRDDLLDLGLPERLVAVVPNACGLDPARAELRCGAQPAERSSGRPVLALGLHRRGGLDQALAAWRQDPHLPTLWLAGRDQGAVRTSAWQRQVADDPALRGRIRFLGPVWGRSREQLLDEVALWLCLYPADEDSINRLCPLQVADAAGSGLPLVASDLPSIRRQLKGQRAELVAGDDPVALAAAIRRGLDSAPSDPLERPRWQDRAKRLIELA